MRTLTRSILLAVGCTLSPGASAYADEAGPIQVKETEDFVQIDTDALQARIAKKGYVSGVRRATLIDKKTGAHDIGFGLHIMDFLLAPGWREDEYGRHADVHGDLPKHYVEGPQICTQARKLKPEIIRGKDFVAVRLRYRFTKAGSGYKAGSLWEQTMVFRPGLRYMLSAERITSVNDVDELFYRIDMPGHIQHKNGDTFAQVYLSYRREPIPTSAFAANFPPDAKFLYQRREGKIPSRMIRAYRLKLDAKPGPWLGGLTLDPAEVSEAWCHQRGYVCFIQELHRRKVKAGESFGAAYAVGYFDEIADMEKVCDQYKGKRAIRIEDGRVHLD
jgi:hypothetical protein